MQRHHQSPFSPQLTPWSHRNNFPASPSPASALLFCAGLSAASTSLPLITNLCLHIYVSPAVDQLHYHACGVDNFVLFAECTDSPLEETFHLQELARDFICRTSWYGYQEEKCAFPATVSLGNVSSFLSLQHL